MATPDQFINTAAGYVGISGTDNMFNTWYWGYPCYNANIYPWCAAFQSYVGVEDLRMPFSPSASAAGVAWQGTPISDEEATRGDWVLFNWDGRQDFGWADHIGVVEWSDIEGSGYFGTIEGNTGWADGGEVARMTRNNWTYYGTKFFRPPYDYNPDIWPPEPAPEPAPEPEPEPIPVRRNDLKLVKNDGGDIFRLYNPKANDHILTDNEAEKEGLQGEGWELEGVAFKAPKGGTVPVYRMYNPATGDHLFTANYDEACQLWFAGWEYEGVPFFGAEEGVEVHRLYDKYTDDHHFTANAEEKDGLVEAGWDYEGVAFLAEE